MTATLINAHTAPVTRPVRKFLIAASLILGLAAILQPVMANARGFGAVGHGGGHGWGGRGWGGYWGPAWGIGLYAPLYAWGAYPYGYPYPYYYDPVIGAPLTSYPGYVWPESARADHQEAYAQALAAPIGQEIAWSGGGISGTVTSIRDGHSGSRYCREFLQKVVIDGHPQQAYGAACQTADGGWQIVPDNP